jgi:hypothetical protein
MLFDHRSRSLKERKTMNVLFAGETVDARHIETYSGRLRPNDILMIANHKFRVETVQTNCPHIENLYYKFTNVILRAEDGSMIATRELTGKVECYRPKRKVLS